MEDEPNAKPWLEELSHENCLAYLREGTVGRLAIVVHDAPVILPVNFRLVETVELTWIALRTRPGNVIEAAPPRVAFEIDGIDAGRREGWSVLVRGTMHHVDPGAADFATRFDAHPWLADRDAWLVIEPFAITGRRLHATTNEWAFHQRAYL
jgi:nitroimidazol reductase NimA-like FMN-containing flavoprotein (pyridoxamine 5'-phosphate oxidase superfamily)